MKASGAKRVFVVALLVVGSTTLGSVGRAAAAGQGPCPSAPAGATLAFSDVTTQNGLESPLIGMMAHATAWGDVNNDGWQDLFVGTFADRPASEYQFRGALGPSPDRLLLGGPSGFAIDQSFPEMRGRTSGAAFADLDGDGDLDLVIARNYRAKTNGTEPTVALRNDGGHFVLGAVLAPTIGGRSIGVLDYDGDGRLDLFIAEDHWSGGHSQLLHNDGGWHFSDATAVAGLPTTVQGLGVSTVDLNQDAKPDLFVSGSIPPKNPGTARVARIFVNVAGTFHETDASAFDWPTYGNEDDAAGVAVADLNRDGLPDVVIGEHYGSTLSKGTSAPIRAYLNRGVDGSGAPIFEDVTQQSGLPTLKTKSPHVEITDFDNDGWSDILTTGSADSGTRPTLLRNLGVTGGVPTFSSPTGLGDPQYWPTGATADVDHDGRVDSFLAEWFPAKPSLLLHNDSVAANWLSVSLTGPNRGVGSLVDVYCAGHLGDAASLIGSREIGATTGFGAGTVSEARFGLGAVPAVDVRIRFPSGQGVANLSAVAANQVLQVASSGPPPDPPSLSVADASVLEGNSGKIGMNFTVSLSQAPAAGTSVSVKVATANGTAKAHNDYFALPSTTLVFGPGETVKVVTVFVKGETIHESNETFLFELSSPVGATLADSEAIATIINDD